MTQIGELKTVVSGLDGNLKAVTQSLKVGDTIALQAKIDKWEKASIFFMQRFLKVIEIIQKRA